MKPEVARQIFSRSLKRHKVRYADLYGEGDSKSHEIAKNTYLAITVRKLQCVRHVQKRVGNRCLKLKKKVKCLGGRGKLTKRAIDSLQNFYGIAIRSMLTTCLPCKRQFVRVFSMLLHQRATTTILHTVRLEKTVASFRRIKQQKHQHTNTDLACQLLSI